MRVRVLLLIAAAIPLAACGDDAPADLDAAVHDAGIADATPPDANLDMPGTLAETGLYSDWENETVATGVYAFSPEYALWSDNAAKRRWVYLPPGTQIDTTDMDNWVFPEGAKLWKEFTRDGVRVETRLLLKNGPDASDWYYAAYAWNGTQDQAVAIPLGTTDALGTGHDIPSRSDCRKCHDRMPNRILGFSAILLDHPGVGGEITLADVITLGWLTTNPISTGAGDYFPVPGTATEQAALGYLHSNCGNCHNPRADFITTDQIDAVFRLEVGGLETVDVTSTYAFVDAAPRLGTVPGATAIFEPGAANASAAYLRMISTSAATMMPPIGHEIIDAAGAAALEQWITALTP